MNDLQTRASSRPLISILVPVFNEEENLPVLYQRVSAVTGQLADRYDFEFVFTDNHSTDGSFSVLEKLAAVDRRIRVFRFSKNFGFQRSIMTGYMKTLGDAAIQIDCDLQDPPELFGEFLAKFEEGYDVVYGIRRSRQEGFLINGLRAVFYRIIDSLAEDDLPHNAGDFRLVSQRVIDAMKQIDDYHPYIRGMIAALGFRQTGIPYDRAKREKGKSKFSFRQLMSLAVDGILSHSIIPLRIASLTALAMSAITLIGIVFYVIGNFVFGQEWPAGFATTTVLLLLSITLNALFLGVIGEYLGRIYQQVKKRPITVIETTINE
ncbi:MAG: glycosyltransferase family 2 protein [Rhodospirillales bacterium]|nr:glycosyltransferase family 2 protein [Rhodospirillales bacterium]